VSATLRLADLDPRMRKILQLVLRNQGQICQWDDGRLEIRFRGQHVEAFVTTRQRVDFDDDEQGSGPPPEAA
jgi:hypothetical protein